MNKHINMGMFLTIDRILDFTVFEGNCINCIIAATTHASYRESMSSGANTTAESNILKEILASPI